MSNKSAVLIGSIIILIGVISLINTLFRINLWAIFWPLVLIALGILLILRPSSVKVGTQVRFSPLGDVHRHGTWQVMPEEIWTFVGDIHLDLTEAIIPSGETTLRILGFVGDLIVWVPKDVGVCLASSAFYTDGYFGEDKIEAFLTSNYWKSPRYAEADRKIRLEAAYFVYTPKIKLLP